MNKNFKIMTFFAFLICFIGCSFSRYNYVIDPTPIVKGETKYTVSDVKVTISQTNDLFLEKSISDKYLSEENMAKIFKEKIIDELKNNHLFDSSENGYQISITLNYNRVYVTMSNTVTAPTLTYSWIIEKNQKPIAKYSSRKMKINRGAGKGFDVFTKIGSSEINPQVEPLYLEVIAKSIVENDIVDVGMVKDK